ncbi:MAG: class I SAM-dependent methyltransferase [Oscillospiraceae bacterium]|nr:class I SAM-dependent methyltransferase [Oscillospiraceae bacterium]
MKIIIYGVGEEFNRFFSDSDFVQCLTSKKDLEIIGIADGNVSVQGNELCIANQAFKVCDIREFTRDSFDRIIITTQRYFNEIKSELIERGYEENNIDYIQALYWEAFFNIQIFDGKAGIEIGGPSDLFACIYPRCTSCDVVNFSPTTVWWKKTGDLYQYKSITLGNVIISDATEMYQIKNQTYDFLLSSNNLEHIANPLKALLEFSRILKNGGYVLILVPVKEETFDHDRPYTTFEHLLADYAADVGEDDMSHLHEIIEKHDYAMDPLCEGRENFIKRAQRNIENRCLHHHVFNESCLRQALNYSGFEVIEFGKMGSNFTVLGKKRGV